VLQVVHRNSCIKTSVWWSFWWVLRFQISCLHNVPRRLPRTDGSRCGIVALAAMHKSGRRSEDGSWTVWWVDAA